VNPLKAFPSQYTLKENDVFYYIHIPKTAGMTFRTVVADYFRSDEICPATLGHMMAQVNPQDLPKYRLLQGHLVYVDFRTLLPQKHLIHATMLREPVAQLVSHYEYIRRMPTDPDYAKVKEMSLEEFVQYFTIANLRRNTQTYHVAKAARFDIENLPAQDVFEIALESLDHFTFVGLVERFQDSLFLLSYIFGWRPIMNTRKENASHLKGDRTSYKKDYADRIPPATLQLIQENTQLDQQLYDYANRIFSDRFTQMVEDLQQHYLNPISTPFTALSPELLTAQLEKHYEQRYRNLNIPTTQTYRYDFAQTLRGSGWQRREQPIEGLTYRWTGPDTVSTLDLPIAIDQDLILEFRVICTDFIASDILNSLTVTVNDKVIPLKILHLDPVTRLFQGTIPQSIRQSSPDQSFTRLTFQVNRVVAFRNSRDSDTRSVGVAINEVQVFPVTMGARFEIPTRGRSEIPARDHSLALQLFDREFWQEPITFLQTHLHPKDAIIAPLSFQVKLPNPIQPYEAIAAQNIQWVVLQKDQTEHIVSTLFKLLIQGFHPVFANGLFVIFTTHSKLPKVAYTSVDVKPLYVDILKRNFRKIVAKFTHAS
jgi:Sulfotransferase family